MSTSGGTTSLRDDALSCLESWTPPPGRQERLRAKFVQHLRERDGANGPEGTERACVPGHLTAGVLVLSADLEHVLLNLHGKAQRWFHFGGHLESGDLTLAGAALREGREESGLVDLDLDPVPVHVDEHTVSFCGDHPQVQHLDVRFTAIAPVGVRPAVSDESLDVRWWPVAALPADLEYEMHEMIAASRARWARRS